MTLFYIIAATASIGLISFFGMLFLSKKQLLGGGGGVLKLLVSLAAGSLLTVAFLDLIPEAIEITGDAHRVLSLVLVSVLGFFILEKFFHWHHCGCDEQHGECEHEEKPGPRKHIIVNNLVGDGIHNFVDGVLIAAAFMVDVQVGVVTAIAIVLHEIPLELSDLGVLMYSGLSRKKALFYNILFSLTAVLGGVLFYYIGQTFEFILPYLAVIAAGNFIYLAMADLMPILHDEKDSKRVTLQTIMVIAGALLMYGIGAATPHSHGPHEDGHEQGTELHEEYHDEDEHMHDDHDSHDDHDH